MISRWRSSSLDNPHFTTKTPEGWSAGPNWVISPLHGHLLVGGGAVECRNRDVVEAEVDAKLRGVVDKVVEAHLAEGEGARIVANDMLAEAETPGSRKVFVGGAGDGVATGLGALLEVTEAVFSGFEYERNMRSLRISHVHAFVEDDVGAEARHRGAVHGEFAELHRLVVTLPVVFAFGDALERAASVGDLDVVVLEEDFCDGHGVPFRRMFT